MTNPEAFEANGPPVERSQKTLLIFALIGAVALVLLVVVPLQLASSALDDQARQHVAETTGIAAEAVSSQMNSITALVETASKRSEWTQATSSDMSDPDSAVRVSMRYLQASNPNVTSVFLLDAKGQLQSIEPPKNAESYINKDFSWRDYYSETLKSNRTYVDGVITSVLDQRKIIVVSRVITDPATRDPKGVLAISIDATKVFQSYVDKFSTSHGVALTLSDQHRHVIAAPGNMTGQQTSQRTITTMRNGELVAVRGSSGGHAALVAVSPVNGTGWTLSVAQRNASAFEPVHKLRTEVLVIAAVLAVVLATGLLALNRSIRRNQKVQRDLGLKDARMSSIIETAAQIFVSVNEEGRVVEWNRCAEETFGYTKDEAIGHFLFNLVVPEEERHRSLDTLARVFRQDPKAGEARMDRELLRSDQSKIVVEVHLWVTGVGPEKLLNFLMTDVSERRRLERERELVVTRQRQLVEELRRADRVKTDFISTVSHELRTPLTSIIGYLEMLNEGYAGDLNDRQNSMLGVIDRNSGRLLNLIDDVLTLSRIEAGTMRGLKEAVSVQKLIRGVMQALLPSAMDKEIQLTSEVTEDCGNLLGDYSQLERVLLNLLSNAVKFTPSGGNVRIVALRERETVKIEVVDTGIGIPTAEQGRMFSRFFRSSNAQDQAIQGTGLGLTIVKSIIDMHGGSIGFHSVAGAGTTFTVELPAPMGVQGAPV